MSYVLAMEGTVVRAANKGGFHEEAKSGRRFMK